jgi:hypothetical protein
MNDPMTLAALAAVAGWLALGVGLILLGRADPARGRPLYLLPFLWLAWIVGAAGTGTLLIAPQLERDTPQETGITSPATPQTTVDETQTGFVISLACGMPPPDEDSELARLFDYAEDHEGELVDVDISFQPGDCGCGTDEVDFRLVNRKCHTNPDWWLAEKTASYHCVEALGLAGHSAGSGSICFPPHDLLPLKPGYAREQTAILERIRGPLLVNWEWSLGAPHLQLLIPE